MLIMRGGSLMHPIGTSPTLPLCSPLPIPPFPTSNASQLFFIQTLYSACTSYRSSLQESSWSSPQGSIIYDAIYLPCRASALPLLAMLPPLILTEPRLDRPQSLLLPILLIFLGSFLAHLHILVEAGEYYRAQDCAADTQPFDSR